MSDIAFLLIIFFAVAGKFTHTTDKEVSLPSVDQGQKADERDITLVVAKDGSYYINDERCEAEALKDEITAYLPESTERDARTVVVHADRDAEYGAVAKAIEAINQADAYLELAVRQSQ
jgi:biopolymer transport protein ExbD